MVNPERIQLAIQVLEHKGPTGLGREGESQRYDRIGKLRVLEHGPCRDCRGFGLKINQRPDGTRVIIKCYQGGDPTGLFPSDWMGFDPDPVCEKKPNSLYQSGNLIT